MQDKLQAVHKELKDFAAAMTDKVVRVAQPIVAPQAPVEAAVDSWYVAPSVGMHCPYHRHRCFLCDKEGHLVVSCPIRAEMFHFMQQEGRNNAPPARRTLPPALSADEWLTMTRQFL